METIMSIITKSTYREKWLVYHRYSSLSSLHDSVYQNYKLLISIVG